MSQLRVLSNLPLFPFFFLSALLLGTVIGYFIYAMCGLKDIGPGIDYSGIVSSAWVKVPPIGTHFEFHSSAISTIMPILIVLLAENLG